MMQKLEKLLLPMADSLSKNKVLSAIRDGFMVTVPVTIICSVFLLIANFPVQGFLDFMTTILGVGWDSYLNRVTTIGFDCIALITVLSIGYCYTGEKGVDNKIGGAITALACFLIITPQQISVEAEGVVQTTAVRGFGFTYLGTQGMFLAMFCGILAVEIFVWAVKKKMMITLPEGVPPAVMESFMALIPSAIAMFVFFVVGIIFSQTSFEYVHYFIYKVLQAPLVGMGKMAGFEVIYQFLSTLFWFFGINGPSVTGTVFSPIHKVLSVENYEAAQAGLEMTNIFTQGFSDFFCNFGGGGSPLGLVITMSFLAQSKRMKTLGRLALPAGIFGMNEPIVFGFPLVLNPTMAIPLIFTPVINTILAYVATVTGFLPITLGIQLPWSCPPVFSGFLVTGSIRGSIVQIILVVVDMLIYYPFFKILDRRYYEEENRVVTQVGNA